MAKTEKKSAKKSSSKIDDLSVNTENGAAHEAYKHCKAIASGPDSVAFLKETFVKEIKLKNLNTEELGVITDGNADKFIRCIARHRFWNRDAFRRVPA